jgi:hypothetical protein
LSSSDKFKNNNIKNNYRFAKGRVKVDVALPQRAKNFDNCELAHPRGKDLIDFFYLLF